MSCAEKKNVGKEEKNREKMRKGIDKTVPMMYNREA